METTFSKRQKIEITVAALAVLAYLFLLPAALGNLCSAPHEGGKAVSYRLSINGQSEEHRTAQTDKKAVGSPLVSEIKATGRAYPAQDPNEIPESWWDRFWCEVNASDWFIGLFTLFLAIATYFLWRETERLAGGADDQADKMERSVGEAAKAATAMQGVAEAMATNVERVRESIAIQREMVDRQKLVTELQSRAYLAATFELAIPQNIATGFRFEPRIRLVNLGNTPAYDIQFQTAADVLPHPLPEDFAFPLNKLRVGSSMIAPRLHKILAAIVPKIYPQVEADQIKSGVGQRVHIWGRVDYRDAFGITRTLRFGQSLFWQGDGTVMSEDTDKHNDAD